MANLQEVVSWEAGIYQLETGDPVLGGPGGISNKQAQALANRTAYLKNTSMISREATRRRARPTSSAPPAISPWLAM
ncbi:hypothetical protein ACSZMZ_06050 [Aeromonas veronii]